MYVSVYVCVRFEAKENETFWSIELINWQKLEDNT